MSNPQNMLLKVRFYIISLWLLFFLVTICTIKIPCIQTPIPILDKITLLLETNIFPIISFIFCILCFVLVLITEFEWKGSCNPPYTIKVLKNENYEYLTFLTTCIIPLICIDFEDVRYIAVFVILLFVIGIIFIKMDLYYGNPTLAILGYKLYRIEIDRKGEINEVILITKDSLDKDSSIKWIEIDKHVWFAKEIK